MVAHICKPVLRRQRQEDLQVSLSPAWTTQKVPGQPGLHTQQDPVLKIKTNKRHQKEN